MHLLALIPLCLGISGWTPPSTNGMKKLELEALRAELKFPALAAAVIRNGSIAAAGVAGRRAIDGDTAATLEDKFHIGSCTKSVTALLAVLNRERIPLETKLSEVFPAWHLPPQASNITLRLLLQNRSGLGNEPGTDLWRRTFRAEGEPRALRKEFLQECLKQPLDALPGEKFIYSNPGYALAGAMIEERLGASWEDLVRRQIFEPFKLASAGFGALDRDEAQGHRFVDGKPRRRPSVDNPVAIAPAGRIHMSILDLARYAAFHLAAANGEIPELADVRPDLYEPPANSQYALGWLVLKRSWAGGNALTHAGSNTIYHTVMWLAPRKNFAVVVSANIGDSEGDAVALGCERVASRLIEEWLPVQ
jgi:CubicO group peptidase (beta-lactamase class C family)